MNTSQDLFNGGADPGILERWGNVLVGKRGKDQAARVQALGEDGFSAEGKDRHLFAERDGLDGEGAGDFAALEERRRGLDHLERGADDPDDADPFAAAD